MNNVPEWLNYGSFGLLVIMIMGLGWAGKWMVTTFLNGLLISVKELEEATKGLKEEVLSMRSENKNYRSKLNSKLNEISDTLEGRYRKSRPDETESVPPA